VKKVVPYLITLFICIVGAWIIIKGYPRLRPPESHYAIPRHIEYSFTLQNRTAHLVRQAEFWTYAPVRRTSAQQCINLEASHPYKLISGHLGNQILHFTLHELPPFSMRIITVKANLLLSDAPIRVPLEDPNSYLRPEKYCESEDPAIARLASRLKAPDPIRTVENIFQWVADHIGYTGYVRNPRGALFALKSKKGDCTEFMYLFTALCRANKIPARGVAGYIVRRNTILKPHGFHNWAEFYEEGAWKLADPQNRVFMKDHSRYVATRIIGGSRTTLMRDFERFRLQGEGLRARMNS